MAAAMNSGAHLLMMLAYSQFLSSFLPHPRKTDCKWVSLSPFQEGVILAAAKCQSSLKTSKLQYFPLGLFCNPVATAFEAQRKYAPIQCSAREMVKRVWPLFSLLSTFASRENLSQFPYLCLKLKSKRRKQVLPSKTTISFLSASTANNWLCINRN